MEEKKRIFTVLCIDGGGIRGVIPARILEEIEKKTGKPIAELFDLIGGASTGAIIAGGLLVPDDKNPLKPKFTAKQMKDFYFLHGGKVFPEKRFKTIRQISGTILYDPKPLDDALKSYMGGTKLKETLSSLMIPATDIINFRPVWISHFKGQKDTSPEAWGTIKLDEAIRAATTVPTYFPAKYVTTTPNEDEPHITHRHALIDGGFFAGNMLRRLMTQARRMAPPDAEIVVVHVGTGYVDHSIRPEEFNKLGPIGFVTKENGALLMHMIVNMNGLEVRDDVKGEIGKRYIGFDGVIDHANDPQAPSSSMDDASLKNMQDLEKFAERVLNEHTDDMQRLCTMFKERNFAAEKHAESLHALQTITAQLEESKTVKNLASSYRKILNFISDIPVPTEDIVTGDDDLKHLAKKLNSQHKSELDRIYHAMQDRLESQSQIMNQIRQTADDISKFVKRIDPFKSDAPPPANENQEKPLEQSKKSFKPHRPEWW